jgi:hypothetical protein
MRVKALNEPNLSTTQKLSERIKYGTLTIHERLEDSVLIEGIYYFRPFGGRKILYIDSSYRGERCRELTNGFYHT